MNATAKNGDSTSRNGKTRVMIAIVMLAVGGFIDLLAIYGYATQQGQTYGPLDFLVGPLVIVMGLLQIALGPTAFRKRARWAWKILLVVPVGGLLNVVYDWFSYAPVPAVLLFFVYAGLGSLALLLTYRTFFAPSWKHQENLHLATKRDSKLPSHTIHGFIACAGIFPSGPWIISGCPPRQSAPHCAAYLVATLGS